MQEVQETKAAIPEVEKPIEQAPVPEPAPVVEEAVVVKQEEPV